MKNDEIKKLKFPIGRFQWVNRLSPEEIKSLTEEIRSFPSKLEAEIKGYSLEDLKKDIVLVPGKLDS